MTTLMLWNGRRKKNVNDIHTTLRIINSYNKFEEIDFDIFLSHGTKQHSYHSIKYCIYLLLHLKSNELFFFPFNYVSMRFRLFLFRNENETQFVNLFYKFHWERKKQNTIINLLLSIWIYSKNDSHLEQERTLSLNKIISEQLNVELLFSWCCRHSFPCFINRMAKCH